MAKGQKKKTREVRKPKQDKSKSPATPQPMFKGGAATFEELKKK
jgi:hypothetical protein